MLAFAIMFWCIDKAYSKEIVSLKEAELADTKDKLCLAEHKVKQLKLELELKRPGESRTSLKGEPTDETEQQKGNLNAYKRRQVLKRKPKTEMNENKD